MNSKDYWSVGKIRREKHNSQYWEVHMQHEVKNLVPLKQIFILLHHTYVPWQVMSWEATKTQVHVLIANDHALADSNPMQYQEIFVPLAMIEPYLEKSPRRVVDYAVYNHKQHLLGYVQQVVPRTLQPILSIKSEEGDFLVPFHEAIVTTINHKEKKIVLTLPADYLVTIRTNK